MRLRAVARFLLCCVGRQPTYRSWSWAMPNLGLADVDPELSLPLGQIIIRWSALEYFISMLLATFLNADQGGMMVITNNVAVSVQSKWIRALMASHDHEAHHSRKVVALLERADDLRSERNEFVHGIWDTTGCQPKTALVETVNLDRAELIRSRLVTPKDLNDFLADIESWIADYVALGRELGFPRHRGETKSIFSD
jgi:hypothetical protein